MKYIYLNIFILLVLQQVSGSETAISINRWEHNGEPMIILYMDGGSFGVSMKLNSGKSVLLVLDQAFVKEELPFGVKNHRKKEDGKLYLGEENFQNRRPFKGSPELIESMMVTIYDFLLEEYPDLPPEKRLKESENLGRMYKKLEKLLVEQAAGGDAPR